MRPQQIKSLTELEIDLLFYVMNDCGSRNPLLDNYEQLLWLRNDAILWKMSQYQSKLNEEGKNVFQSLMTKLNMTPYQEVAEYANRNKPEHEQLEFQF